MSKNKNENKKEEIKNNKKNEAEGQSLYDELWKTEIIEHKASEAKKNIYKNAKRSAF